MPSEESLIEDLREIEEEFRQQGEHRKANVIDLFIRKSVCCKISREKIMKAQDKESEKIHLITSEIPYSEQVAIWKASGAYEVLDNLLREATNEEI